MDVQWVQSKYSAEGEKFRIANTWPDGWDIRSGDGPTYYVPRSEYIPCAPPERWERVEAAIQSVGRLDNYLLIDNDTVGGFYVNDPDRYRVVSVVVERKVGG